MDDRAAGAAALLTALDAAAGAFRTFGYERFLEHQSVGWELLVGTGFAQRPGAAVGVAFQLNDAENRHAALEVEVRVSDGLFEVLGSALVDDPLPTRLGGANQRYLRELPEVRTASLEDCIAAVAGHTFELCSYTTVLEELGVPRT